MRIKRVGEILWKNYYSGRPKATGQTIRQKDIEQFVILAYGSFLKKEFNLSKKEDEFGEPDYSLIAQLLETKEFDLSEPNTIGMRKINMSEYDLYRLPNNNHFTRVYPIGGTCGSDELGTITQVEAGEEYFYIKPEMEDFLFFVAKGRTLEFYHLPHCVKKIAVEAPYSVDDADVSLDIAYDISLQVLGVLFKEKNFPSKVIDNSFDGNVLDLKHRLQEQENSI